MRGLLGCLFVLPPLIRQPFLRLMLARNFSESPRGVLIFSSVCVWDKTVAIYLNYRTFVLSAKPLPASLGHHRCWTRWSEVSAPGCFCVWREWGALRSVGCTQHAIWHCVKSISGNLGTIKLIHRGFSLFLLLRKKIMHVISRKWEWEFFFYPDRHNLHLKFNNLSREVCI